MALVSVAVVAVFCFALGYLIGDLIEYVASALRSRGEVADAPELPPCGMRLVLTEEQVEASFAEIEKNFTVKPRENR